MGTYRLTKKGSVSAPVRSDIRRPLGAVPLPPTCLACDPSRSVGPMASRRTVPVQEGISQLDVGAVYAYADGFASAVVTGDSDLIASYLCEDLEPEVAALLDALWGPIEKAEVLTVNPLDSAEFPSDSNGLDFSSLTRLWGMREEVLLRSVWMESHQQLLMRDVRIVERVGH